MKKQWIDFKALRRDLSFERVLSHYNVQLHVRTSGKGRQHNGLCPFQTCKGTSKKRTFSANLDRGIFQCFKCRQSGNVLDFIAIQEGFDPSNAGDLRKAAEKAKAMFIGTELPEEKPVTPAVAEASSEAAVETVVNAPLDFELQSLDPDHPWFRERGLCPETVAHFGLGYCPRGWLKGRIAIPLRNGEGKLIGYAGRLLEDVTASAENPLYAFPKTRIHNGATYEFRISEIVYNIHELQAPTKRILVTPFLDTVWSLWQHGQTDAVSIMGSVCYPTQMKIFIDAVQSDGVVWIVSEEHDFPHQSIAELTYQIALHRKVRWCSMETIMRPLS